MFKLNLILFAVIVAVNAGTEHQNQGYFQYANLPAYGQYEFGYNRGNPSHYTSRYEQGHDWRFRSKIRWGDKYGGYGEHYYDYNHVDKGQNKGKGHDTKYAHQSTGYGHNGWKQIQGHGHGHESPSSYHLGP